MLDPDAVQCHVEVLGDEGGQRGRDPLAHFGARRDDGDGLVAADLQVRIECDFTLREVALERVRVGLAVIVIAHRDAAGRDSGQSEEGPPGDRSEARHDQAAVVLPAARLMAARIRG